MAYYRYRPPESFPPIVKNLIIINVLVFFAQMILDSQINLSQKLALWPIRSDQFYPYQIFTRMFAHTGIGHLLFNMLGLWLFGRVLENRWGSKRFLFFYLACGIGAAALHLGIQYFRYDAVMAQAQEALAVGDETEVYRLMRQFGPLMGASGAITGVAVAFAYLFPNTELMAFPIPVPIKAKWLVLIFLALDLLSGIANSGRDNVAHFSHLGGALTGFIIVYIWNKTNRRTFY
jgi:membrane associated rhomboid family serine protease